MEISDCADARQTIPDAAEASVAAAEAFLGRGADKKLAADILTPTNNPVRDAKITAPLIGCDTTKELTRAERHVSQQLERAVRAEAAESIESSLIDMERVRRPLLLTEAGTGRSFDQDQHGVTEDPEVKYPCIAWSYADDTPSRLLTKAGLGKEKPLREGTHAFVKMSHESLRVGILPSDFGHASGHPHLSLDQPVEYAGEIEVDTKGHLVRWNNLSGTYRIPENLAAQAGLPLDKFWAVRPLDSTESECVVRTARVALVKLFETDEETFVRAVREHQHLGKGKGHHRMVQERLDAIHSSGYLSIPFVAHRSECISTY